MNRARIWSGITLILLFVTISPAVALDTWFSGPRALGMGGANIASVNDTSAQYYNPAAFGFMGCQTENGEKIACDNNNLGRKDWGTDLNAAAGIRMHKNFGDYVDSLASIDYQRLSVDGIQTESDLVSLIKLLNGLKGLEDPGNAVAADINASFALRAGHFALGARTTFQASGQVLDVDTLNLGITNTAAVGDLNAQLVSAVTLPVGYTPTLITGALNTQLLSAGLTAGAIASVDSQLVAAGVTSTDVAGVVTVLSDLTGQTLGTLPVGALSDNTTTVALQGFAMAEVPLSYGYALNDHWSVGANLKVLKGRVYGTEVLVFDNGSGDVIAQVTDNYADSTTFGLDLGVMGRYRLFNFGLIGRNLNSPEFDGFDVNTNLSNGTVRAVHVDSVKVKPQFAAGIAFIPYETLTFEVDCDLTKNETLLRDYATRNLSAGLEWDAFRFLALRLGAYKNLAQSDIGLVYTAGLGLNFWAMRLDLAGAVSGEKAQYDGKDYPKETRVSAQLSVDF